MFLIGTEFALLFHIIVGLVLCVPPLLPQWKKLLITLNEKKLLQKQKIILILMISGLILTAISIISITFHHSYILRLNFINLEAEIFYFHFFALFTFFLMPGGLAFIGTAAYLKKTEDPRLGNFFLILLALIAMGLAGSFLHDVLWCGTRTGFFAWEADAGYDIDWWLNFMHIASKDYRNLLFYMGILVCILITYASILLYKHGQIDKDNFNTNQRKKIVLYAAIAIINLGFWLYVMDYARLYFFIWPYISTYVGIPFSIVLFYYLGKNL